MSNVIVKVELRKRVFPQVYKCYQSVDSEISNCRENKYNGMNTSMLLSSECGKRFLSDRDENRNNTIFWNTILFRCYFYSSVIYTPYGSRPNTQLFILYYIFINGWCNAVNIKKSNIFTFGYVLHYVQFSYMRYRFQIEILVHIFIWTCSKILLWFSWCSWKH